MNLKEKIIFYSKFAFALALVATTMAVACPQPINPSPVIPDNEEKSKARILFEGSSVIGLYQAGEGILLYNSDQYQTARNDHRGIFRIQSDNQRRYLNVEFTSGMPHSLNQESFCTISYRSDSEEETDLIIKLKVIAKNGGFLWLWNDIQEIGIIIIE